MPVQYLQETLLQHTRTSHTPTTNQPLIPKHRIHQLTHLHGTAAVEDDDESHPPPAHHRDPEASSDTDISSSVQPQEVRVAQGSHVLLANNKKSGTLRTCRRRRKYGGTEGGKED